MVSSSGELRLRDERALLSGFVEAIVGERAQLGEELGALANVAAE